MSKKKKGDENPDAETPAERANLFMERAKQLSLIGKASSLEMERLLKEVFKALSFDDNDSKNYMFLAKVFKHALDLKSAIFCYRYALKLEPTNFQAKKYLCELLILNGKECMVLGARIGSLSKYTAACAYFDEALEVNREDVDIWTLKCICHVRMGELTDAYEAINRVIKPNRPAPAEAYILRAKILWARGLTEQGNVDIRVAGSLDPHHPEVLSFAGRSFVKAEKLYKECLKAFTAGEMKEALEHVKHALFITSEDVKLHIMLAKIYRLMGDLQSAYTSILKAKAIFEDASQCGEFQFQLELPSDIVRQVNLILNDMSIKYVMAGDYDRGILLLNKILKTEKSLSRGGLLSVDHKYFVNRGDCYRALHKLPEAIADYNDALLLAPKDWEIRTRLSLSHYLIATVHFNQSQFEQTELELDRAIEHNPKVSEYFAVRGKARYYNGNFNKAFEDFQRVMELDPSNDEIRQRLEQFDGEEAKPAVFVLGGRGAPKSKALQKQEQALTLSIDNMLPRYSTEQQVMQLKVSTTDQISMMLNPHAAKQLPTLRLLTSSGAIATTIRQKRAEVKPLPRIHNDKAFNNAMQAETVLVERQSTLDDVYRTRIETGRGAMWNIVDTAKVLARELTHPDVPPSQRGNSGHKKEKKKGRIHTGKAGAVVVALPSAGPRGV